MRKITLFLAVLLATGVVMAQNLAEVQARMVARRAVVSTLLAGKNVGENNQGYLEALKPLTDNKESKTLAEENADRKVVYAAIAQKTGAKTETVARTRAREIAKIAATGTMVQSEKGVWEERK